MKATRMFFSYDGYNDNGIKIAYGSGAMDVVKDVNLTAEIVKIAKKNNEQIESVHIIALTPIEFRKENSGE